MNAQTRFERYVEHLAGADSIANIRAIAASGTPHTVVCPIARPRAHVRPRKCVGPVRAP
jgi:hypothetical protein